MSCKVQQIQTQANGWDFVGVQPPDLCEFKLLCSFTVVRSKLIRAWWVNEDGWFLFLFRQLLNTYYRMKLLMEVLGSPDKLVVGKCRQRYMTTELRASPWSNRLPARNFTQETLFSRTDKGPGMSDCFLKLQRLTPLGLITARHLIWEGLLNQENPLCHPIAEE